MAPVDWSTLDHVKAVMVYNNKKNAQKLRQETSKKDGGVKGKASFRDNTKKSVSASRTREELPVYDARPAQGKFDIDTHGFIIENVHTKMEQSLENIFDQDEKQIRSVFWPEVEELAKRTIRRSDGALPKYAMAIGTQKFVPLTDEQRDSLDNPFGAISATYARIAHADFSEVVFDSAYKMFTKRGIPEEEALGLDLMLVNAWKPYGMVVHDNAFAILDWTTVDVENDVHIHPRGKPTNKGAIYSTEVTFNPNHRWVYLPDMRDDEIWFFKQGDSRAFNKEPASLAQYGFHTSFKLPDDPGSENKTRRSIALRLLLGYEKAEKMSSKL